MLVPTGSFTPQEYAPDAVPPLLTSEHFQFAQTTLHPGHHDLATNSSEAIVASTPQALDVFNARGYARQLKSICDDYPGTPYAQRASELLMHGLAEQESWEGLSPGIKQFAADNALPMVANTIELLDATYRAHTQDKVARMLVGRTSSLLGKVAGEGLWTPEHTADLCSLLEQGSLYTPDIGNVDLIMREVVAHYNLPPDDYLKFDTNHEVQGGRERTARQLYLNRVAWLENMQPGAARSLREIFGLRSFIYSTCDHLAMVYYNRNRPAQRTSFALIPTPTANDYVFHADTLLIDRLHHDEGSGETEWFMVQYETVDELAERLDSLAERFPFGDDPFMIREVPFIAILGHGDASAIDLEGPVDAPTQVMTAEELEEKIAPRLRRLSTAGTTIVMSTCKAAGKPQNGSTINLAEAVHRQTGRKVIAGEGYNVMEDLRFVRGAMGELTVEATFAATRRDVLGEERWMEAGKYTYPARDYGAAPPARSNSVSGPAPDASGQ